MSNVVVSWEDNKGVEYHATVIYSPETGTTYYWRNGSWVKVIDNQAKEKLKEQAA